MVDASFGRAPAGYGHPERVGLRRGPLRPALRPLGASPGRPGPAVLAPEPPQVLGHPEGVRLGVRAVTVPSGSEVREGGPGGGSGDPAGEDGSDSADDQDGSKDASDGRGAFSKTNDAMVVVFGALAICAVAAVIVGFAGAFWALQSEFRLFAGLPAGSCLVDNRSFIFADAAQQYQRTFIN